MLDFFIALFGVPYYAGRYIKEKIDDADIKSDRMARAYALSEIERKHVASYELQEDTKKLIASGEHYEEICSWLEDDFRYIFGDNWRECLKIPPIKHDKDLFVTPSSHGFWVYHLLLAKEGKIDWTVPYSGLSIILGRDYGGMNIKFAERIERRLHAAGAYDIRLGLSAATTTPGCGKIMIESLFSTTRLWSDYDAHLQPPQPTEPERGPIYMWLVRLLNGPHNWIVLLLIFIAPYIVIAVIIELCIGF